MGIERAKRYATHPTTDSMGTKMLLTVGDQGGGLGWLQARGWDDGDTEDRLAGEELAAGK